MLAGLEAADDQLKAFIEKESRYMDEHGVMLDSDSNALLAANRQRVETSNEMDSVRGQLRGLNCGGTSNRPTGEHYQYGWFYN